jgi:transcriptional regulator with XRE-family HTH domain
MGRVFGDYLRQLREDRQYTLRDVEQMAQVSNAYLSQVERGERGIPHFKVLKRLAEAYGVPLSAIIQAAEQETRRPAVPPKQPAPDAAFVSRGYEKLPEEKRQELKNFLQYLLQEEQRKGR